VQLKGKVSSVCKNACILSRSYATVYPLWLYWATSVLQVYRNVFWHHKSNITCSYLHLPKSYCLVWTTGVVHYPNSDSNAWCTSYKYIAWPLSHLIEIKKTAIAIDCHLCVHALVIVVVDMYYCVEFFVIMSWYAHRSLHSQFVCGCPHCRCSEH